MLTKFVPLHSAHLNRVLPDPINFPVSGRFVSLRRHIG